MNDVGRNLRRYREEKKLTQDALAEKLHVTRQAVSNWENGKNRPDLDMLEAAAKALDLELTDIIYGKRREYPRFQRKAVIWSAVLGGLTLLALGDALFLAPWLLELRSRTFQMLPYAVNELGLLTLGCVAGGMLIPALLSLLYSLQPKGRTRILLRILPVLMLIPALLTMLFILVPLGLGFLNRIVLFFMTDRTGFRMRLALRILPFLAGACLYPAWVRLRAVGE